MPQIDQWRPRIEAYASETLGARVDIGHIEADWRGLNPRLKLTSLSIYDDQAEPVLVLPEVSAVLAWRSVLLLSPSLLSLRIDGPELRVRRDTGNHLWVAGQSIDLDGGHDARSQSRLLRWLGAQRDIALANATVHWHDQYRQAPEMTLRSVSLRLYNGTLAHRFALNAEPPAALARDVSLRGRFSRNPLLAGQQRWTGEIYAEVNDAEPSAWAPWLAVPKVAGRAAARAWLTLEQGAVTDLTLDTALRDVYWQGRDATSVGLAEASLRVQGAPGDVVQFADVQLARGDEGSGMALRGELTGLRANLPHTFDPALLQADTVRIDASLRRPAQQPAVIDVRQLDIVNTDLDARLHGRWTSQGKTAAGTADFQGNLARAAMPAIYKYLPLEVNADAREWLARGLPAGQARDASVTVKGDLDEFPFEDPGDVGEFRIAGAYAGAIVDYAPAHGDTKGWPRLENLSGHFAVDKVSLSLDSPGGAIAHTGDGHTVTLGAVTASIPDMEHHSILHVDGQTSGPVPAYLALAANSPLGELLDGTLESAEGTGTWQVPLKLEVPLLDADDTKVDGRIIFAGNNFRFVPQMPELRQLHGVLHFSELGIRTEALRGEFLDGPATVSGRLEHDGDALNLAGTLPAAGLAQLTDSPAMERFTGQTRYRGKLGYGAGGTLDISIESDLAGLGIDLPAPIGKARADSRALKARWAPAESAAGKRDQLSVNLGTELALLLEHDRAAPRRAPYFLRGALGVHRSAALPSTGLAVDVQMPELDLDAWEKIADEATPSKGGGKAGGKQGRAALPMLNRVDLQTTRLRTAGWTLDDLKLSATRPQPDHWQVQLDSRQAAGSLAWQEASGAIAGQVTARLTHLAVGSQEAKDATQDDTQVSDSDLSDIPAIDLRAEQFSLYGHNVGALEVLGTNLERGKSWRLDKLRLASDSAELDATGNWRLEGAQRGLTVDAKAQFKDLGAFMDSIGYKQVVGGGSGTVQGKLTWRDLPWTHDLANIDGEARVSLDKGRFMNVNSRSARLLELLSLQSVQRLAKLEFNPANLLRDGFPFDTIRGDMTLSRGILHTEGYKLSSPVATIVLAGDTDIVAERWDLQAVVIPNLDASGAAVVTALAVNPLIGLGAFVTQWLLKQPLARAMTMEYTVTGSWDAPKLQPVETKPEPKPGPVENYIEH
nr:YhdP family protein [Bordetella sp. BOR01]